MYYTQNPLKTKEKNYTKPQNLSNFCTPNNRCNNFKKCPHCWSIWKKEQYTKATKHLKESRLKDFKYKSFLTVVSLDTAISLQEKNSNIDLFLNDLIKGSRYKSHSFFKAEYFTMKQISFNDKFGYNPHLHIIYLSNKKFIRNKKLKELLSKYNLRIDKKDIYKDTNNTFKTSIQKLVNYCLKSNNKTFEIESTHHVTKNKRLIKKSALFSKRNYLKKVEKEQKKARNLLIHIHAIKGIINRFYNNKIKEAKAIFKKANKNNAKTYIKKLKTFRKKVNSINKARAYYLARVQASAGANILKTTQILKHILINKCS